MRISLSHIEVRQGREKARREVGEKRRPWSKTFSEGNNSLLEMGVPISKSDGAQGPWGVGILQLSARLGNEAERSGGMGFHSPL